MIRLVALVAGISALVACGGGEPPPEEPAAPAAAEQAEGGDGHAEGGHGEHGEHGEAKAPPPIEVKPRAVLAFHKGDKPTGWDYAMEDLETACKPRSVQVKAIAGDATEVELGEDWTVDVSEVLADHDHGYVAVEQTKAPIFLPYRPSVATLNALGNVFSKGCK